MTIQHVYDENGRETAVIVPIEAWEAILDRLERDLPERDDTSYLLGNPVMRERLLASARREGGMTWDEVRGALGL